MTTSLLWPDAPTLRSIFSGETAAIGGEVINETCQGEQLFMRAVVPHSRALMPGDTVDGGVALRTRGAQVRIYPYVFRRICSNGAIFARALDAKEFDRPVDEWQISEAFHQCASPTAFLDVTSQTSQMLKSRATTNADSILLEMNGLLAPLLRSGSLGQGILARILSRLGVTEQDLTGYGVMNAITSVARDIKDPEVKWELEEIGGAVPAFLMQMTRDEPAPTPSSLAAV